VLTLQGSAPASAYQAALQTVKYVNDIMTDLFSMSVISVRTDRVIMIIARSADAESEEAMARVSFDRSCGSSVEASSTAELHQMAVCVVIKGNAIIKCTSMTTAGCDIKELDMLSDLREVTGKLTIENTKVEDFAGLENVWSYGSLRIDQNTELVSTIQLRKNHANLLEVSDVIVEDCGLLEDILGLRGIENVTGDLTIKGTAVSFLTGLDNLTSVEGDVIISDNQMVVTLDSLTMLQSVGGSLTISDNGLLTSLNGLSSLTSIGGLFTVSENDELTCLSTLQCLGEQPVTFVGDSMLFMNNKKACFEKSFWDSLAQPGKTALVIVNQGTGSCPCQCH
jgi:hypothetical protein